MEACKIKNLYNLKETIAAELFEGAEYPWEVLAKIKEFILRLGSTLSEEEYERREGNVWIAKSAKVAPTAFFGRERYHRERRGGSPLRFYPGQRHCWGGRRGGEFHGAEKRGAVQ